MVMDGSLIELLSVEAQAVTKITYMVMYLEVCLYSQNTDKSSYVNYTLIKNTA